MREAASLAPRPIASERRLRDGHGAAGIHEPPAFEPRSIAGEESLGNGHCTPTGKEAPAELCESAPAIVSNPRVGDGDRPALVEEGTTDERP
jgi:hypothetical protein